MAEALPQGIITPVEGFFGIVNRRDISNGKRSNNRPVDLTEPATSARLNAIIDFLKTLGVQSYEFWTRPVIGGYDETAVILYRTVDGMTFEAEAPAVDLIATPDNHIGPIMTALKLPQRVGILPRFPGVEQFRLQQGAAVVGKALPDKNPWDWPREQRGFDRYWETGPGFKPGMTEYEAPDGSLYRITSLPDGPPRPKPGAFGFIAVTETNFVQFWERLR